MNNIALKLRKCWTHKLAFKMISTMLKQQNLFYIQPSTLPTEAPEKFYLSSTFGLSFTVRSVDPARSYAYLILFNNVPFPHRFFLCCAKTVSSRLMKLSDFQ